MTYELQGIETDLYRFHTLLTYEERTLRKCGCTMKLVHFTDVTSRAT